MIIEDRIKAFEKLGDFLMDFCIENSNSNHPLETIIQSSSSYNGWFTSSNIRSSISAICNNLSSAKLSSWLSSYSIPIEAKKNVSIIMAGNIPLVGFNDFLCVLMSGHRAIIKLSSKDNRLFSPIIEELIIIEPRFKGDIKLVEKVENFDAVIATGSNESFKHFEYYFKDYPTLLRKSRTSVAILTGEESLDERKALANDIFLYYGLGCRNVTKLYVPKNYDLNLNEIKSLGVPFGFKLNAFIKTNPKPNYTGAYKKSKTGNPNEFLGQRKDLTPEKMAEFAKKFKDAGATILGGCCETRPSHIKAISDLV